MNQLFFVNPERDTHTPPILIPAALLLMCDVRRPSRVGLDASFPAFQLDRLDLTTLVAVQRSSRVSKVAYPTGQPPWLPPTDIDQAPPSPPTPESPTTPLQEILSVAASSPGGGGDANSYVRTVAVKWLLFEKGRNTTTTSPLDLAIEAANLQRLAPHCHGRVPRLRAVAHCPDGSPGFVGLAMDFVRGCALHKLFYSFPHGLQEDFIRAILWQLTTIFQDIQNEGYVYRDLKLPNVLVADSGIVSLIDFHSADRASHAVGPAGTRHVRAPEACGDQARYAMSCDLFSLGIVTYELATGRPVLDTFERSLGTELHSQRATVDDVSALVQFPPTMSPDLRSFILATLEPDPRRRFGCIPHALAAGERGSGDAEPMFDVSWSAVRSHQFFGCDPTAPADADIRRVASAYAEEIDMQLAGL